MYYFQMDFYEALYVQQVVDQEVPVPPPPPPPRPPSPPPAQQRRQFRQRTSNVFFQQMSDFEFKRTFRFSKEAVTYLTELLGNNLQK